ncbi:hypothetical protein B9Z55_012697 [Caenorhabditis nigoni]|uniref:polypeptide N-acetylgalactosaminyltransferase n=1 Tax=Caenorhabditis nigoni TaxID=1611254 RepID=A0A2G5TYG9_9PELO|nr:hypothetical protein B9Z55_012697 [Caenorhabditis nigoni]
MYTNYNQNHRYSDEKQGYSDVRQNKSLKPPKLAKKCNKTNNFIEKFAFKTLNFCFAALSPSSPLRDPRDEIACAFKNFLFVCCETFTAKARRSPTPDTRNYKRVAEVWMDEYKETLYKHRPGIGNADAGDLKLMKGIREKLQCKSFDWFMKEIAFDQDKYYPAIEPKASAEGEIRHVASNLCIDTQFKEQNQRFGLRKCASEDKDGGGEQDLRLTRWHDIRPKGRKICFDVSTSVDKAPIILFDCHSMKGNQLFKYRISQKQIYHPVSGQCLTADENGKGFLHMKKCDSSSKLQQWAWQTIDQELLDQRQAQEPKELE